MWTWQIFNEIITCLLKLSEEKRHFINNMHVIFLQKSVNFFLPNLQISVNQSILLYGNLWFFSCYLLEFHNFFFPFLKFHLLLKRTVWVMLATQPCINIIMNSYDVPCCSQYKVSILVEGLPPSLSPGGSNTPSEW